MRCQDDDCDHEATARGRCLMHYKRWRRRHPNEIYDWRRSLEERLWAQVDKTGDCWLWTGSTLPSGYGTLSTGSRTDGTRRKVYVHVLAYELLVGPVPPGH